MKRHSQNGIEWLTFHLLDSYSEIKHAVFTKKEPFHDTCRLGFNLGRHTSENPQVIDSHFQQIKELFNLELIVSSKQVHGKHIEIVSPSYNQSLECDGLITRYKAIGLLISHADCQCAIFYDPVNKAIANVHSGWKGSKENIYAETVQAMQTAFGTKSSDLIVCIGPSLCQKHAEFCYYRDELPEAFWKFKDQNDCFDFWGISRKQLLDLGVLAHHIEIAKICTFCKKDDFFSYRRQVKESGKSPLKAANGTVVFLT